MPICDGYKATHLLRHHVPYKSYVRDVPIVAMTASAIQGDREKCRRAGMDDYLAKPVRSQTLEQMLVRWSLNRRTLTTPAASIASSQSGDCYESSDDCTNSGIPCVGIEDEDDDDDVNEDEEEDMVDGDGSGDEGLHDELPTPMPPVRTGADASPMNFLDLDDSRNSLPTPRPKASPPARGTSGVSGPAAAASSSRSSFFDYPPPTAGGDDDDVELSASSPAPPQVIRRVETDELAQQSRDDKLLDAAGAGGGIGSSGHTPLSEKGEALTEANVEKFQREERSRRDVG